MESDVLENEWHKLETALNDCTRCGLSQSRTNVVLGRGNRTARVMFVGEGPGEQEDLQGSPFVGPAGKLLDLALDALQYEEDDYYIANIVKCRPPGNREPSEEEAAQCMPFLRQQFKLAGPKILVCLGATAAKNIIDKDIRITSARGRWVERKGLWIMPTFHPAALLRDEGKKMQFYIDLKEVRRKMLEKPEE
jgi:uracil-DNA glycosylase family 4